MKELELLNTLKTLDDIDCIRKFELEFWRLLETGNPEIIIELFQFFDDDSEYDEVMYSMIHSLESLPTEIYLFFYFQALKDCINIAPLWMENLCCRILNTSDDAILFKKHMHIADKESLLKLFSIVEKETPHHKELIAELRKELD